MLAHIYDAQRPAHTPQAEASSQGDGSARVSVSRCLPVFGLFLLAVAVRLDPSGSRRPFARGGWQRMKAGLEVAGAGQQKEEAANHAVWPGQGQAGGRGWR